MSQVGLQRLQNLKNLQKLQKLQTLQNTQNLQKLQNTQNNQTRQTPKISQPPKNLPPTTLDSIASRNPKQQALREKTLFDVISKAMGRPTSRDELRHYKLSLKKSKFAPLFAGQIRPKLKLVASGLELSQLPNLSLPEIAFFGKINSGKSKLLRAVLGAQGSCARGREIQVYQLGSPPFMSFADLPGYPPEAKPATQQADQQLNPQTPQTTGWQPSQQTPQTTGRQAGQPATTTAQQIGQQQIGQQQIGQQQIGQQTDQQTAHRLNQSLSYIKNRANLKLILLLIDCKLGLKERDLKVINFCQKYKVQCLAVLSKADRLKPVELAKRIEQTRWTCEAIGMGQEQVVAVSAKGQNLDELRERIESAHNKRRNPKSQTPLPPNPSNEACQAQPSQLPAQPRPTLSYLLDSSQAPSDPLAGNFGSLVAGNLVSGSLVAGNLVANEFGNIGSDADNGLANELGNIGSIGASQETGLASTTANRLANEVVFGVPSEGASDGANEVVFGVPSEGASDGANEVANRLANQETELANQETKTCSIEKEPINIETKTASIETKTCGKETKTTGIEPELAGEELEWEHIRDMDESYRRRMQARGVSLERVEARKLRIGTSYKKIFSLYKRVIRG